MNKRKNSLGPVLLLLLYTLIQTTSAGQDESISVIKGKVIGDESIVVTIEGASVPINSRREFIHQIQMDKPKYVELNYGHNLELYLTPGDEIKLTIDNVENPNPLQINGDGAIINRFLFQESLESERASGYFNSKFESIVRKNEQDYRQKVDEIWYPFKEKFEAFIVKEKVQDKYFIKSSRAGWLFSKASILIKYPEWHRWMTKNPSYTPSKSFDQFFLALDFNDPELWDLDEYRDFLGEYLDYQSAKTKKNFKSQNYALVRAKMQFILDTFHDPLIRSEMLYSLVHGFLGDYYHKNIDDLVQIYFDNTSSPEHIKSITEIINREEAIRKNFVIQTYKEVDGIELDVFLRFPEGHRKGDSRPGLAFFHGGAWECGKPEWGNTQCMHFAEKGLVTASFEYRLITQHDATPVESVMDAKSAIRWLRKNAFDLGIDPNRIVASGFSAGGHIALCTHLSEEVNESTDDLAIDPSANAFLFWVTPFRFYRDYWSRLIKDKEALYAIDPMSHVREDMPPCAIFQGTEDEMVSPDRVKEFEQKMLKAGNRCDLHMYEGQTHLGWGDNVSDVLHKMEAFLESIHFLPIE